MISGEQNDEWQVGRRSFSTEAPAKLQATDEEATPLLRARPRQVGRQEACLPTEECEPLTVVYTLDVTRSLGPVPVGRQRVVRYNGVGGIDEYSW